MTVRAQTTEKLIEIQQFKTQLHICVTRVQSYLLSPGTKREREVESSALLLMGYGKHSRVTKTPIWIFNALHYGITHKDCLVT